MARKKNKGKKKVHDVEMQPQPTIERKRTATQMEAQEEPVELGQRPKEDRDFLHEVRILAH